MAGDHGAAHSGITWTVAAEPWAGVPGVRPAVVGCPVVVGNAVALVTVVMPGNIPGGTDSAGSRSPARPVVG